MLEEHVFDLLPGYALACLDEEDLLKVARHLPQCAICRNELSTYWAAADQIALAAPLRIPPLDLKARVLQRVEQAAAHTAADAAGQPAMQTAVSVQPPERQPASTPSFQTRPTASVQEHGLLAAIRSLFSSPLRLAVGALVVLLIAFMGISNFLLWQRVNDLQARVPQGNLQLVQLQGTTNAPLATGYMMAFPNETYGTLVVENAPPLPSGHQYQLWLVRDGKRTNGGVFTVSEEGYGTLEVSANQPLTTFQSFGITIEPWGGSPGPTGKKVLGGKL